MVRMFDMYRNDKKADFNFLHVFIIIEGCDKWAQVRHSLGKGKAYVPDAPAAGAADGRPDGHKKAKAVRDAAPAAAKLQASIDTCIADAQTHAAAREEKAEARWKALMANQGIKLDLLKTNTAAKKRNNDLAFLMGGNPEAMDPEVRAWFMAQRRVILSQIAPAPTPTATATATADDTSSATPDDTSSATITPPPSAEPTATQTSAPAPTTTPIDLDEDAEVSPATI